MNRVEELGGRREPITPYWLPHLCRLADAVEVAEARRIQAQAALDESELALNKALIDLCGYYGRLPHHIPVSIEMLERVERLASMWLRQIK